MSKDIYTILTKAGLSEKEARVYVCLLRDKKMSVSSIAKEVLINRTTTYDVVGKLNKMGLVVRYQENNKTTFSIDTTKRLLDWVKESEEELSKRNLYLKKHISEIEQYFNAQGNTPRFRYFEGKNRIEEFYNDPLAYEAEEILVYSNLGIVFDVFSKQYNEFYQRERKKKQIMGKYIVRSKDIDASKEYANKYFSGNEWNLVQCRALPPEYDKETIQETMIYVDRVSIAHFDDDFFGVIMESRNIAYTQRTIFNALWKTLKVKVY